MWTIWQRFNGKNHNWKKANRREMVLGDDFEVLPSGKRAFLCRLGCSDFLQIGLVLRICNCSVQIHQAERLHHILYNQSAVMIRKKVHLIWFWPAKWNVATSCVSILPLISVGRFRYDKKTLQLRQHRDRAFVSLEMAFCFLRPAVHNSWSKGCVLWIRCIKVKRIAVWSWTAPINQLLSWNIK